MRWTDSIIAIDLSLEGLLRPGHHARHSLIGSPGVEDNSIAHNTHVTILLITCSMSVFPTKMQTPKEQ